MMLGAVLSLIRRAVGCQHPTYLGCLSNGEVDALLEEA